MNETTPAPVDPRIYLAAERTFLAWIRTGIAFMGFGFVVARFGLFLRELALSNTSTKSLVETGHSFSLPAGIVMIMAGIVVIAAATMRHHRYLKALDQGELNPGHGSKLVFFVAGFLVLVGAAVTVYLAFVL